MRTASIQTVVRGGFPVNVTASILPAEPDVGIFERQVEDIFITNRKGKPVPFLKPTEADYDHIREEILNAY